MKLFYLPYLCASKTEDLQQILPLLPEVEKLQQLAVTNNKGNLGIFLNSLN